MALAIPKRLKGIEGGSASHSRAPRQEKELASRLARVTRGSGNQHERGDVRVTGILRIECKTTIKDSFRVTKEMLHKIKTAAFGSGEVPAIVIEFLDADTEKPLGELAVVPTWVLENLIEGSKK